MYCRNRAASLGAAAVAGAILAGCGALPSYKMVQSSPHKDMVSLQVFLDDRAAPEVYRRIALEESARVRERCVPGMLPLYEIKVEFVKTGPERIRLAQVVVILSGAPNHEVARADKPRLETTLY